MAKKFKEILISTKVVPQFWEQLTQAIMLIKKAENFKVTSLWTKTANQS